MRKIFKYLERILNSTKAFYAIIIMFLVQSIWMALTAIYPLPFDEYYHVGLTKIYAQQWSPFISNQPIEASIYGDITRVSSYFFHYLMSFPYRILSTFIDNQELVIIGLRMLNIVFVVLAIFIFKKLFIRWGLSNKITNFVLLVFVFTPIVPFLAAHHNYDNLLLLLMAISLVFVTDIINKKPNTIQTVYLLILTGFVGILVKDQFLPLYGILIACTLWLVFKQGRLKSLFNDIKHSSKRLGLISLIMMILGFVLLGSLVVERYGKNLIEYHTIQPKCEQVQPVEVCEKFMPWYRNKQNKLNPPLEKTYGNPISFTQHWVAKIMRGYFAIFSHTPTQVISEREPFGPIVLKAQLPLPISVAYGILISGIVAVAMSIKMLWKHIFLRLSVGVIVLYLLVLWTFNYQTYLNLGVAQAIQARYTYPILPLIYIVLAVSFNNLLRNKSNLKNTLVLIIIVSFVWGGGIVGYLIRADSLWCWQNRTVIQVNTYAQNVLKHVVIH